VADLCLHDDAQEMKPDDRSARRLEYPSTARDKDFIHLAYGIDVDLISARVDICPGPCWRLRCEPATSISRHLTPRFWDLLDGFAAEHKPALICGDTRFHNEPVIRETEQRGRTTFTSAHGQHQRARSSSTCTVRPDAYCCLLRRTARDGGTVDHRRAMVPSPSAHLRHLRVKCPLE
jgi:hypothetical protein